MHSTRRQHKLYVVNRSSSSSEGEQSPVDVSRSRYSRPDRSPSFPRTHQRNNLVGRTPPIPRVPAPPLELSTVVGLTTNHNLSTSLSSPSSANDETPPPSTPDPRLSPVYVRPQPKPPSMPLGNVMILATRDAERYTKIDVSRAEDSAFVRDYIFQKLEIHDNSDRTQFAIYRADFGTQAIGEPLSDDLLWNLCQDASSANASLVVYIRPRPSPPTDQSPMPLRFSPAPSSSCPTDSPIRSRNNSMSSTSEYDADLDNNEDDRRATIRPYAHHHAVSASLPTPSIMPTSARPQSPPPRFISGRQPSSPQQQQQQQQQQPPPVSSNSLSPNHEKRIIMDRVGNVYPHPPPPPPLSPTRASFDQNDEASSSNISLRGSIVPFPPDPSDTPSSVAENNSIRAPARRPPISVPRRAAVATQESMRTEKFLDLKNKDDLTPRQHEPASPEAIDSPSRSSPVRSPRTPLSATTRMKNGINPSRSIPSPSTLVSSGGRKPGQPLPPNWAVSWKPEGTKQVPHPSSSLQRFPKGAKSMDNLRGPHPPHASSSRRPPPLPRPSTAREAPASTRLLRPLPLQGPISTVSQLDLRTLNSPNRPALASTSSTAAISTADPYPRPSSAFGDGPLPSPSGSRLPSRHLQSPTYDGTEPRTPRGISPIRPLLRGVVLTSRSVPPTEEPRLLVDSPTQGPPSPRGGRSHRERFESTVLPNYRSAADTSARDDDNLAMFLASTAAINSSAATSSSTQMAASNGDAGTLIGDDDSDASSNGSGLWAIPIGDGPRPDLSIQTNNTSLTASPSGPQPPVSPKRKRQDVKSDGSTFTGKTWAIRPPPEDVFEEMEKYFPDHDIDKPVLESNSGGTSPTSAESGSIIAPLPPVAPLAPLKAKKNQHKKSLRMAAGEHISNRKRVSHTEAAAAGRGAVVARRMTRLWGSKIEEVTSDKARSHLGSMPESAHGGSATFKWVRGELIGRGTYGQVYLALNATTGEMMAVKQVEIPQTASDMNDTRQATVVQALKLESETLKDLDHPHIVQYLGFEQTPSNLSIFLEYVPGGSIGSCLQKHGKFDEDVTRSFTSQILSGLEYLHSKSILHRDLKADNILVEHHGVCKISDFGISKRTDDLSGGAHTAMQGTVFWMAPEVLSTGEKGYNSKIDIWSVGCVLLEMWGGRRPWSGSEMMAVMFKLYHEKKPPPVPDDVELSPLADEFRKLCFAINPADRPSAALLQKHPYLELPPNWTFNGFK